MNIAIIGSRTVKNYEYVKYVLNDSIKTGSDVIVSGGAKGADELGERFAREFCDKEPIIYKAEWEKYGRSAGFKRNHKIIEDCEMVIAFWDYESKGTKHSLDLAKDLGKCVFIYGEDFNEELGELNDL